MWLADGGARLCVWYRHIDDSSSADPESWTPAYLCSRKQERPLRKLITLIRIRVFFSCTRELPILSLAPKNPVQVFVSFHIWNSCSRRSLMELNKASAFQCRIRNWGKDQSWRQWKHRAIKLPAFASCTMPSLSHARIVFCVLHADYTTELHVPIVFHSVSNSITLRFDWISPCGKFCVWTFFHNLRGHISLCPAL